MARVSHKRVKQLLNEKRSKITDRQFFTSRILAGHFEDMAAAQTRRYHYNRRVHVHLSWEPKSRDTAATDNEIIKINAGNPFVTKTRGREARYWIVCGMFAHELGHVLYTDFLSTQTWLNSMADYRWYPAEPMLTRRDDRYNEAALGICQGRPKYGEIKYGDEPTSDERVQTVFGLIPDIDHALLTRSGKERLEAVNIILIRCWEYLKGYLELLKAKYEAAEAAGESTEHMNALAAAMSGLAGSSAAGTGSMRPVCEDGDEEESSATEEEREKTRAEAEESRTEGGDDESASTAASISASSGSPVWTMISSSSMRASRRRCLPYPVSFRKT